MRLLKILFLGVFLFAVASQAPALGQEGEVFYFSHGQRITLQPDDDYLMVKYRTLPAGIEERGEDFSVLKDNVVIQKVQKAEARAALEDSPDVLFTSQVYGKRGAWMAATDEIIVKFDPSLTGEEIDGINAVFGAAVKRTLLDGSYLLELTVKRGKEAITIANEYYLLNETEYAHPNFLRHIRVRPEGPKGTLERPPAGFQDSQEDGDIGPLKAGSTNMTTIFKDKFKGAFPGSWSVFDGNGPTGGEVFWGKTGKKYKSPSKSVWCAKGGADGVKPGQDYPNDMDSWMVYGPFDLSDANYAEVTLNKWLKSELNYDFLGRLACIDPPCTDPADYYGYWSSGNWAGAFGWIKRKLDLTDVPTLGDITGQSQVWFALVFESDFIVTWKGAYVDDVTISKFTDPLVDITLGDAFDEWQWSLNNIGQNGGRVNADIDAPQAWLMETGDSSVVVAVIDEGVDLSHPDLVANLVGGYDATDQPTGDTAGGPEPGSDDAHGTACAGIIAAVAGNGIGGTGIAPGVSIMPVRIAYGFGGGWWTFDSWIAAGINWAWMNGADVLSNSWGGGWPSDTITSAIQAATNNGSVVLFSSGNDNGPVSYPATRKEVIAVGATSPCDQRKSPKSCDGEYWWGSNKGKQLDVVAPGVLIPTTDISGADGYSSGDYVMDFNGTSSACPHAAGVVALMLSANPSLTVRQVKKKLYKSADDLGPAGWDKNTGHGRVNARKAVKKVLP